MAWGFYLTICQHSVDLLCSQLLGETQWCELVANVLKKHVEEELLFKHFLTPSYSSSVE